MTRPVALVGAYSMSNYGDQLYPVVLEGMLRKLGYDGPTTLFAPLAGRSAGRTVAPLTARGSSAAAITVVGGGDLVRSDRRVVAMDQLNVGTGMRRLQAFRPRTRAFARKHLPAGPGPWLPERGWEEGVPAVLASVGVHELAPDAATRAALSYYGRAWVRSHTGALRLRAAGYPADRIAVAPDAVFALRRFIDGDAVVERGRQLLRDASGARGPVMVVHAAGVAGWDRHVVRRLIEQLSDVPVVTMPLGCYAGEDRMLRAAAAGTHAVDLGLLEADDITAVLAAAGCLVTTSMHAAIVAVAFGRPLVVPKVEKIESALRACATPPEFASVERSEVAAAALGALGAEVATVGEAEGDAALVAFDETLRPFLGPGR